VYFRSLSPLGLFELNFFPFFSFFTLVDYLCHWPSCLFYRKTFFPSLLSFLPSSFPIHLFFSHDADLVNLGLPSLSLRRLVDKITSPLFSPLFLLTCSFDILGRVLNKYAVLPFLQASEEFFLFFLKRLLFFWNLRSRAASFPFFVESGEHPLSFSFSFPPLGFSPKCPFCGARPPPLFFFLSRKILPFFPFFASLLISSILEYRSPFFPNR